MAKTAKPKTARQRLEQKKDPKIVVLKHDFAGAKCGEKMFVATPGIVDDYVREIPRGEVRVIEDLRHELAQRRQCAITCPMSTSIFIRIVAEAALEDLAAGVSVAEVTPFWRLVEPESKIAKRLPVDSAWIAQQRDAEA